jgi:hypothetical protein
MRKLYEDQQKQPDCVGTETPEKELCESSWIDNLCQRHQRALGVSVDDESHEDFRRQRSVAIVETERST